MSTTFNVVRFRAKPGHDKAVLAAHRKAQANFRGLRRASLVKTGQRGYVFIGEWTSPSALHAARPQMIAMLDTFRDDLEDMGDGLGVTDPVSGEVAVELRPAGKTARSRPGRAAPAHAARSAKPAARRRSVHAG